MFPPAWFAPSANNGIARSNACYLEKHFSCAAFWSNPFASVPRSVAGTGRKAIQCPPARWPAFWPRSAIRRSISFSRDVEGLEPPVLQGFDLSVTRPEFNLVEDWDKTGVRDFLTGKGYAVHTKISDKDTLFRLN